MNATAAPPGRDPVSTQVAGFLAHLAVGVHKLRAYPPGHPMRQVAVQAAYQALGELLRSESALRIGVGHGQFQVGDGATDPDHFIIRDLASRLHRRQLGGIVFHAGLTSEDFTAALEALATEPSRTGAAPTVESMPVSPCRTVEFVPIALDALALRDGDVNDEVDRLWQELARLVAGGEYEAGLGGGDRGGIGAGGWGSGTSGPIGVGTAQGGPHLDEALAALADRFAQPEVRANLCAALERFGRLSHALDGDDLVDAEARFAALLGSIPNDALAKALEIDLRLPEGRQRLIPVAEWLPTMALVELIESAARDQGQKFSAVFLRLLKKLAGQSSNLAPRRAVAGRDLRLLVRALVEDWTLADPNSKAHAHILDTLARHDLATPSEGAPSTEGLRLAQIALETNAVGDAVAEAVEQVVAAGQVSDLVQSLVDTPGPNPAADGIWRLLAAPAQLRRILRDEQLRPEVVSHLLSRVGADAVDLLLERLLAISSLEVQREMLERVLSLGNHATESLLARIEAASGEHRRRYLHILSLLAELPPGFSARRYLEAPEPLVRLEAMRLMVRRADERDDAIWHGLADDDERVVRYALEVGRDEMPRQCLSRLIQTLNSPRRSPELKARAIPVLAQFDTPSIRQWLLTGLVVRRGWFRRRRLAPTTPIVIAKLGVLAQRWADHAEVARALELARRSGDPDLVAAVGGQS